MATPESLTFLPEKRTGLIFQGGMVLFFSALCGLAFLMATRPDSGGFAYLWLFIGVVFLIPAGLLIYRIYSLAQGSYSVEREGLRLRWGIRAEDIPLNNIQWIRPVDELGFELQLPVIRWQGAIVGTRETEELGAVEFMAGDTDHLLLVVTPEKVYAISPEDIRGFLRQFQYISEMGSLTEFPQNSVKPMVFMQKVWADKWPRIFILAGLVLNFLLFVLVSIYIPNRPMASLGYDNRGRLAPPGPSDALLLFPVLAGLAYLIDLAVGFYFYRKDESVVVAYIIWASSVIIPILLILVMVRLI
jgi:hypothetical protein